MGAFDDLPMASGKGGAFDDIPITSGGVQDYEPITTRHVGTTERPERTSDYIGSQLTKAYTGLLGMPRAAADLTRWGGNTLGLPEVATNALVAMNPMTGFGAASIAPSAADMNRFVHEKIGMPDVGSGSKIVDAGVQSAMTAPAMPGSVARNVIPLLTGGAASEAAGQATKDTPYEIPARILAGGGVGGATALLQNVGGNIIQGVRNIFPNIDETTAKIIGRALERDKSSGAALGAAQADLGPGAMLVEGGGPNVRGTLRGAIAAPGEARTNVQNAFETRLEGSDSRTTAALDKAISPNGSLATTTEGVANARTAASGPAYEASGIPRDRSELKSADRIMGSDDLLTLFRDSPDVQAALRNARKVPELKGEPINSMAVLDRVYKHIGGLEQAQRGPGGNAVRAGDLADLRKRLATAIGEENPAYTNALSTYSEPSKIIDAANRGREWFTKNVDPGVARKEFAAMSPAEQEGALTGVRDWARTAVGRSDRGTAAERVWAGGDHRARLEAILSPEGYAEFAKTMGVEKNAIRTARDINVGSRTAPMGLEAADNAGQANAMADVAKGRFGSAVGKMFSNALERVGEGRTEAVNARIAEMLTSTDPATVGLVAALAEKARIAEAARRSGRINALSVGTFAPAVGGGR